MCGCRMRADEARHDLAVDEDGDGRDALDAEAAGERLLRVDVDLGELDLARSLGDLRFDRWPESPARPAPGGPEVDDDGQFARALDHVALEGFGGDVHLAISFVGQRAWPSTSAVSAASCAWTEPQTCSQRPSTPSSTIR